MKLVMMIPFLLLSAITLTGCFQTLQPAPIIVKTQIPADLRHCKPKPDKPVKLVNGKLVQTNREHAKYDALMDDARADCESKLGSVVELVDANNAASSLK